MMTTERFEDLAGLYGPDLTQWPAARRAAAEAFMTAHPDEARHALAQAHALNDLMELARAGAPDPALFSAVLANAPARRDAAPRWSAMAAAAALLIGLGAGWFTTDTTTLDDEALFEPAFAVLSEDGNGSGWLEEAVR